MPRAARLATQRGGPRLPPFLVLCAMAAEVCATAVPPVPLLTAALNCSMARAGVGFPTTALIAPTGSTGSAPTPLCPACLRS